MVVLCASKGIVMKKFLSIVIIVCLSVNLFALDLGALPEEIRLEYLKNSLSIDYDTVTVASAVGTSYYGVAFGSATSKNKTAWIPYYGEQQISKADFFRIVGEEKLTKEQEALDISNKKNKIIANTLAGIGWGIMGVGIAVVLIPIIEQHDWDEAKPMAIPGLSMVVGGAAIALISLPFEFKSKQELNISTSFVVGLAENYNLKLYASLTK